MPAAEKSVVCRKGTGVRRLQYKVIAVGDKLCLGAGVRSPQDKHHRLLALVKQLYHPVGENLPALVFM